MMRGIDDGALLSAAPADDTVEILYRIKRLLQVNPENQQAAGMIRSLNLSALERRRETNAFYELLADGKVRESLIRAAVLVEREKDAFLCRQGDQGSTMFLILKGVLDGYLKREPDPLVEKPNFLKESGELVGDLAFALSQPRTATLATPCSWRASSRTTSYG